MAADALRRLRYGTAGTERPGMPDAQGRVCDLSDVLPEIGPVQLGALERLDTIDVETLPIVPGRPRPGPPISGTRKIIAMDFSYTDHAAESDVELPAEPLLFSRALTSLSGPHDDVVAPRGFWALDYEAELVVVIGRTARYVPEEEALAHVAGFTVGHDVSERVFQRVRGGQFVQGKRADTFAPVGPWLVPTGHVEDVQALDIRSRANGALRQTIATPR